MDNPRAPSSRDLTLHHWDTPGKLIVIRMLKDLGENYKELSGNFNNRKHDQEIVRNEEYHI